MKQLINGFLHRIGSILAWVVFGIFVALFADKFLNMNVHAFSLDGVLYTEEPIFNSAQIYTGHFNTNNGIVNTFNLHYPINVRNIYDNIVANDKSFNPLFDSIYIAINFQSSISNDSNTTTNDLVLSGSLIGTDEWSTCEVQNNFFICPINVVDNTFNTLRIYAVGFDNISWFNLRLNSTAQIIYTRRFNMQDLLDKLDELNNNTDNSNDKLDETNQQLGDLNDNITSDEVPDTSNSFEDFNSNNVSDSVISDLITLPLNYVTKLLDMTKTTCSPYTITLLEQDITFTCPNFQSYLGSTLWGLITTLMNGYLAYNCLMLMFRIFNGLTTLDINMQMYKGGNK